MLNRYLGAVPPLDAMPKAKSATLRALELNDSLAEAHATLGLVALWFDWDWPASERCFQRALELNASVPLAHVGYAFELSARGRHEEAIAEGRRAVELNPFDPLMRQTLAELHLARAAHDDALDAVRRVIDMDPRFPPAQLTAIGIYEALGRYEEAIGAAETLGTISPEQASVLRRLSREGPQNYWREVLRVARKNPGARHPFLASLHAQLGERDEAFAELERAYMSREGGLAFLRVDYRFDPIRDDPRFDELVRRIGIPES